MSIDEPVPRGRKVARFELLEELGRGGMGVIHRARDRVAQRDVAFKRMLHKPGRSQARMLGLFQREYDTLTQLRHPNIVDVYDYGVDADGPYYVMELLSGDDLSVRAPMPVREACIVLRDVAAALALVHARKLIYRDLSPNNVRLGKDGRGKLIDFGALCAFGRPTELVGTAPFIAPECLTDEPLDQRCDLYALGAIGYALLTNRAAVVASSIAELPAAWERPVIDPSNFVADLPGALRDLLLSMLAIDPAERPESAAYVIERLTSIAELPAPPEERQQALSFLARPPLVGREAVMAALTEALDEAGAGCGGAVLVEAAGGLGRTVVLEAIALEARRRAALVLTVAHEQRPQPFGVARRLYQAALVAYPDLSPDARHAPDSYLSLTPRGPEVARAAPSTFDVSERQAAIIENVLSILREASTIAPVVIVVDDLHEADGESLALLGALAAESRERPLLVIASVRPELVRTQDQVAFARLGAHARRVGLAPLSEEQLGQLVASMFGGAANGHRIAAFLHAQSGGNPATAIDLSRSLLARGVIRYARGSFTLPHDIDVGVDTGLADVVLARLGGLSREAEGVVEALALHEGALAIEELATATNTGVPDTQRALDDLTARGVVASVPEGLTLASSTLRGAVVRQLDLDRRRTLHERLADALLAQPGESLERRFQACAHLLHAGHEAAAAALMEAIPPPDLIVSMPVSWVALLEAVLAIYKKTGRSVERCLSLMLPIAHVGYYGGDLHAQTRQLEEALPAMSRVCGMTLAAQLRRFVGGRLALLCGLVYAGFRRALTKRDERLGNLASMLAHYIGLVCGASAAFVTAFRPATARRVNAWLEPFSVLPPSAAAALMREFCIATTEVGEGEYGAAHARYLALSERLEKPVRDLPHRLREQTYLGSLHGMAQARVLESDPEVLVLAERLGESAFFAPYAEIVRAGYRWYRGEHAIAEQHRARAELLALRGGISWSAATIITGRRAHGAMLVRDPVALGGALSELERLSGISDALAAFHVFCTGWLAYLRGQVDEAVRIIEPLMHQPGVRGIGPWRIHTALWAELANAAGRHAEVRDQASALLAAPSPDARAGLPALLLRIQLALAEARLGDLAGGIARLDAQVPLALVRDNPLARGLLFHARARLSIAMRDAPGFEQAFAEANAALRSTGAPSLLGLVDELRIEATSAGLRAASSEVMRSDLPSDALDGSTMIKHSQLG